jgi:signal transduction histidine kinase
MLALRPRSIQARYTLIATALSLIVLTIIGLGLDLGIRNSARDAILGDTQRSALQWIAAARAGGVPHTVSTPARVTMLQLVDSHGRVVDSSKAASDAPLSTVRPAVNDRIENVTLCRSEGRCAIVTAIRFSLYDRPGSGDPHFAYAGVKAPAILRTHALELFIAVGVLALTALAAGATWGLVGRSLRPVEAIRTQIAKLSGNDLSVRLPQPSGQIEIALLADTANKALDRLESALQRQRQFASDASHELRTPIASLRVQLEEALLYPGAVDQQDVLRAALSATDRINAIVNDLLLLARLRADPAPPEPIDLGELVTREAAARTHGVPVLAHPTAELRVHGHRMQLTRLLDNLLDNAQRHAHTRVEVTAERVDGLAVVSVTDDGDGIAPQDRERVFERFTRLADGHRRDPNGSGLGLAISADIAHAHMGSLTVEDSPLGARFVLRVPLLEVNQAAFGFDESSGRADRQEAVATSPAHAEAQAGWRDGGSVSAAHAAGELLHRFTVLIGRCPAPGHAKALAEHGAGLSR